MDATDTRRECDTVKVARGLRLGTRRLTRAHLALQERPQLGALAREALAAVQGALAQELGCPVEGSARLLDAAVAPEPSLAHSAVFVVLELSASGGTALLELEPALLLACFERLAGAARRPGPLSRLTRLEEATAAYLVLAALAALRAQGALHAPFGPRLTGLTLQRSEALCRLDAGQPHVALEVALTLAGTRGSGRLVLPAGVLEAVLHTMPVQRQGRPPAQVLAARLPAHVLMGRSRLAVQALQGLEVGDVVVLEGLHREGAQLLGPGRLLTGGFELQGDFQGAGLQVVRARLCTAVAEENMTVKDEGERLAPLPVEVEIELARLLLPVSELAALRPGGVLPLHVGASEPVRVRVGDRVVARAELVDIEGEVGARILCLVP